jgi:hypothetical protein
MHCVCWICLAVVFSILQWKRWPFQYYLTARYNILSARKSMRTLEKNVRRLSHPVAKNISISDCKSYYHFKDIDATCAIKAVAIS